MNTQQSFRTFFTEVKENRLRIRGIITTASYEARAYGVKTAMLIKDALALCPHLIVLPPNHLLYHELSHKLHEFLKLKIPVVEQYSVDEFFGDISGWIRDEDAYDFCKNLQQEIKEKFGLPISFGIANSKWAAKLVDDEPTNINILIDILGDKYDILAALDGEDAIKILAEEKVDLILLDIMMPEMDGFEVCIQIKDNFVTEDIPIIFITAKEDDYSIEKAYELGGVDYLTKPFNATKVLSVINAHLSLKQEKEELEKSLQSNTSFFEQYQDAVDEATIISKTNTKGIITYVNEEFCKISGYSRAELINQRHNIIRHINTPSDKFKKLWKTIKNKNTWKGVIENKAKDGSKYVVQSTIKPILDTNGDIIEYVAISQNITEIFNLQNEIIETQKEIIERIGELAETRSKETGHHVARVAKYSALFGKYYGLDDKEIELLAISSPMHDVGKIAIPDNILLKPGKLDKDEFEIMKTHAQKGYAIFEGSKRELLKAAAIVAHEHHEKWDGSGYPRGLKGEEIHIYGRITALADVFDALGSSRVYKKAWDDEKIFNLFRNESGKHFDPKLVDIFFEHLDEFLAIRDSLRDV